MLDTTGTKKAATVIAPNMMMEICRDRISDGLKSQSSIGAHRQAAKVR